MIDWSLIPEKVVLIARAKGFTMQNEIQEFVVVDGKLVAVANPECMPSIHFFEVVAIRPGLEIGIANALINSMNVDWPVDEEEVVVPPKKQEVCIK